ncbi:hypothetical protein KAFR_0D01080 [Kazachstania africana CBS 2517]|uniref:Efficient mitochondria targeting-associated protein 19 n=1 Tax=Kazachstania africana (strain ATCC 22294 / BCRC 22015 / CBS 2517 / CECT 1963 / NBRC 1671 / NRRL Y-8276) TaxID=1071382 RepID=H2ATQ4_KAZAF|nr:hypothetical protein KAFR_0D01080 [Kazachstania africana CBS 2517]CCF57754.1 hypothetical protein KAFR_0D01080 [Kazachstania africana CBS 2517]
MPLVKSPFKSNFELNFYRYYFLIHIPITILIDSCVVITLPFESIQSLIKWHIKENNDFLLFEKPKWLYWFVILELIFQLPLFFYFIYKLGNAYTDKSALNETRKHDIDPNTTGLTTLLKYYGWNASLTSLFCIFVVLYRGYYPATATHLEMYPMDKLKLAFYYFPTFIIPFRLCLL